MKTLDKIIVSQTPPDNTNVAWFDGKNIKLPNKGKWKGIGGEGSGGGVTIVNSEEELQKLDLPLGSIASVAIPGTIKETSIRDLYQPTADIMDPSTGTLTSPELLSSVSSVKVLVPEGTIRGEDCGFYIIPRNFSMQNLQMLATMIVCTDGVVTRVGATTHTSAGDEYFIFISYTDGVPTVDQAAIDKFNAYLSTDDDWCYFGNPDGGSVMTEGQFLTLDKFFKVVSGVPTISNLFIKKGEDWKQLAINEDLYKLIKEVGEISEKVTIYDETLPTLATQDQINKIDEKVTQNQNSIYNLTNKIKENYPQFVNYNPSGEINIGSNKYYRFRNINRDISLNFIAPDNTNVLNEYIVELQFTSKVNLTLPSGIVWLNDISPVADNDKIVVISVINGLGVCAEFKD